MAIDSHMHANSLVVSDLSKVISHINDNPNIESVINVGLNIETSRQSIDISRNNKKFYSAIGIHPLYIGDQDIKSLYTLAQEDKVVAIGEIGIDTINEESITEQKKYLIQQIRIANELGLPVIIHANNANKQIIEIFENYVKPEYGCVFHCFQPNLDDLKYIVDNGFYISFAGRITYKTAKRSIEVARAVPKELFIVETDSPYIPPEPLLRNDINESKHIKYIIQALSKAMEMSYEEVESLSSANTKRLFRKMR